MRFLFSAASLLLPSFVYAANPPMIPLSFEANHGQAGKEIRYLARGTSQAIAFKDHEVLLPCAVSNKDLSFEIGGSSVRAEEPTGGVVNYYPGADRSKWIEGLPLQRRVRYTDVAPGIDLLFHGETGNLEYDVEVAPQADPFAFSLHAGAGASFQIEEDGSATIKAVGVIGDCKAFTLRAPVASQEIDGHHVEVKSKFFIEKNGSLGIDVASYDHSVRLLIDPVVSYTKIISANNTTLMTALRVTAQGEAVFAGNTYATNYPVAGDGVQGASSSQQQPYVTKLDSSGTKILYSTYLPVSDYSSTSALALDAKGNAYIAGVTDSRTFPATSSNLGTCSSICNAGFAAKFNDTGALVYATLLGSGQQLPKAIAVDGTGSLYIGGLTADAGLKTVNPFQGAYLGGVCTSCAGPFFGKLNAAGTDWVYSSYFNFGSSYPIETFVSALALDTQGNLYLAGPGAAVPLKGAMQTGTGSSFVAEFGPDGHTLLWSTGLGGYSSASSPDAVSALHVGPDGTVYLAGYTSTQDFPFTVKAMRHPTYPIGYSGGRNLYAEAINPAHTDYSWVTYLGEGSVYSSAMDSAGNLYLGGVFINGTLQFKNALSKDVTVSSYIVELNPQGALLNATALGGYDTYQVPYGMDIDASGNIYVAGTPAQAIAGGLVDPISIGTGGYSDQKYLITSGYTSYIAKIAPDNVPQISLSYGRPVLELHNAGTADLHLTSIQGDISNPANNCNGVVPAGTGCFLLIGTNKTLTINSDASPASQTYQLISPTSYTQSQTLFLDSSQMSFPPTQNGSTSAPRPLVVTNLGSPVAITNVQTFGDFQQTNNCTSTLATFASCTIQVTVTPGLSGSYSPYIGIVYGSGSQTSTTAQFTQNNTNGPLLLSADSYGLQYGNVLIGTMSVTRSITVTNTGSTAVVVSDPSITGSGASAFSIPESTCAGKTLQPQENCTIGFQFTPTTTDRIAVPMSISGGGSTTTAYLVGTGVQPTTLSMTPSALDFGNVPAGLSAVKSIQLQNTTTNAIPLTNINAALNGGDAAGDYSQQNNCGGSLAAGASCTITVTFKPTALGARSGTASVLINGGLNVQGSLLSGSGITLFNAAPGAVDFGKVVAGNTGAASLTLTNMSSSSQAFTLGQLGTPFSIKSTDCISPLAGGATCTLNLAFAPTARGAQSSALHVAFTNSPIPIDVSLSGTGAVAIATLSSTTVNFGDTFLGTSSNASSITLTNTGEATLTGLSLSLGGANSADFTQTNTCGSSLNAGTSCVITLGFKPGVAAAENATLSLTGTAQNTPQTVQLTGTGVQPTLTITSSAPSVTVNAGDTAVYSITFQVDPGLSGQASLSCGTLPAYASCSFTPPTISLTSGGTVTLNVATSQTATASLWESISAISLAALCFVPVIRRRRTHLTLVVLMSACILGLTGCAGSSGSGSKTITNKTAAGTYPLTVTATSGTVMKTVPLTLVVQ